MKLDIALVLNAMTALSFFACVFILNSFKENIRAMQGSLSNLNINIATLIEKDLNKDKLLDEHKVNQTKIELMVYGLETKTELIEREIIDIKKTLEQVLFPRD